MHGWQRVGSRNARFQQWQTLLTNRNKRQRAGRFLVQGVRPITLAAEGGYHQLGEFFERVAGFPRVVTVQEMKMAGISKSRNPLKADLVLATYQYRPVGSPPAPKPGQPGAQK